MEPSAYFVSRNGFFVLHSSLQIDLTSEMYRASLLSNILVAHGLQSGILKPLKSAAFQAEVLSYFMREILLRIPQDARFWDEITEYLETIPEV